MPKEKRYEVWILDPFGFEEPIFIGLAYGPNKKAAEAPARKLLEPVVGEVFFKGRRQNGHLVEFK